MWKNCETKNCGTSFKRPLLEEITMAIAFAKDTIEMMKRAVNGNDNEAPKLSFFIQWPVRKKTNEKTNTFAVTDCLWNSSRRYIWNYKYEKRS